MSTWKEEGKRSPIESNWWRMSGMAGEGIKWWVDWWMEEPK